MKPINVLDTSSQDLRYAARLLCRSALFTITAVLSVAIGIGANTALFTVGSALLFGQPVGVMQPNALVDIVGGEEDRSNFFFLSSYPTYLDVQQRATMLDAVYGYGIAPQAMTLAGPDGAERVFGNLVTVNYFTVLGVHPAHGRFFSAIDGDRPGATPVAVLNHGFWARRFNKDPSIVGRTLELNGRLFTVLGVAAEGFQGTNISVSDIWVPTAMADVVMRMTPAEAMARQTGLLVIGGRLKPGVSVARAATEMDAVSRTLERDYPDDYSGKRLRLTKSSPIPDMARVPVEGFLTLLMGIVSVVLIISCANLAGVMLARGSARRRELAVRMAIGAGRARLVRQLLTETLLLFTLGGITGLVLARALLSLLLSVLPALPIPIGVSLALDQRVIFFTVTLSCVAALLCGVLPALDASRSDVVSALKDQSQGPSDRLRIRSAFVVGQVAFSMLLVIGAGLFVRALQRAGSIDPGFDARDVELVSLDLSLGGYTEATGPSFSRDVIDRIQKLPGVRQASIATSIPMGGEMCLGGVTASDAPLPKGQRLCNADWNVVEPGYFATMRIPLIAGRDFTAADRAGAPLVAIVGEFAARRFWPGQNPIGQYLRLYPGRPGMSVGDPGTAAVKTLRVVGVARDLKYRTLDDNTPIAFVYAPLQQQYRPHLTIVARSSRGQRVTSEIRAFLGSINRSLPLLTTQTLEEFTATGLLRQRVAAGLSGTLGLVGVLLAAIGIYGVTSYTVARRTREIGVRVALGAERSDVITMVLKQGMLMVAIGCGVGVVLAAVSSRMLVAFLFGIQPLDPVAFGAAAGLFLLIGLAASYIPAHRAVQINATDALRCE